MKNKKKKRKKKDNRYYILQDHKKYECHVLYVFFETTNNYIFFHILRIELKTS